MGLGPGLQGEGRAADVDGGGTLHTPRFLGSPGLCARLSLQSASGQAGIPGGAPPTVEGGSDLGEAARRRPR